jgi:hypothetical protein
MGRQLTGTGQQQAIEELRRYVKAGTRIYTILRHRTASGVPQVSIMTYDETRHLHLDITRTVAELLGLRVIDHPEGWSLTANIGYTIETYLWDGIVQALGLGDNELPRIERL